MVGYKTSHVNRLFQNIFVLKSFKSLVFKALKVCVLFSKFQLSFWLCCPVEHNYHISLLLYFLSHSIVHRALCTISRQTQTARVSQKADGLPQRRTQTPLHQWDVYTLSPAYQDTFSKTAGQSQAYYYMLEFRVGQSVSHLQILTCEVAVSTGGSVTQ